MKKIMNWCLDNFDIVLGYIMVTFIIVTVGAWGVFWYETFH